MKTSIQREPAITMGNLTSSAQGGDEARSQRDITKEYEHSGKPPELRKHEPTKLREETEAHVVSHA